jgi:hypothetical protein
MPRRRGYDVAFGFGSLALRAEMPVGGSVIRLPLFDFAKDVIREFITFLVLAHTQ